MSIPSCQPKTLSTTLSNTGTLNLTVTGLSITGDPRLALLTPPPPTVAAPLVVAPGAHTSLSVRFAPTGSAVASPPSLSLSAASFAFGTIPVNSVLAFRLTLSNLSACASEESHGDGRRCGTEPYAAALEEHGARESTIETVVEEEERSSLAVASRRSSSARRQPGRRILGAFFRRTGICSTLPSSSWH
jgi:hypothetical protein